MAKCMEKENISMWMAHFMKETFTMDLKMGKEDIKKKMELFMMGSGEMDFDTESEKLSREISMCRDSGKKMFSWGEKSFDTNKMYYPFQVKNILS
jgi:hypothetical protein